MTRVRVVDAVIGCHGQGAGAAPCIAGWMSLAATPVFAVMAVLAALMSGGSSDVLCAAAHDASPLTGMATMYALMAAFHAASWLRLIGR